MNSFIEILNRCGGNFLNFAWPMLWQSGVLIALLFAIDFALRKKIRAAIRYVLWLVVLVKLILPPTLASPTSALWWIHGSTPPVNTKPISFTTTYGGQMPDFQLPPVAVPVSPRPHLSPAAFIFVAAIVVVAGLLAFLLIRWRRVAQKIQSASASKEFDDLLDECRQLAKLRSKIQLKLTDDSMSPAVSGLFRPAILLPQSLAKNLSREQLRAVLLHEAIHLRRGDVWLNCAQALLQIFYWWHPLLWFANARIRRVREEAVDDAVMLALRDDAEIYAPTLLEVAKFAFRRPPVTLGLIGILESRSALRQRIERLIDFRAPKKAGLTIVSILGILAFSVIAVPMGERQISAEQQPVPASDVFPQTVTAEKKPLRQTILITTHHYWMDHATLKKAFSELGLKFQSAQTVSPEQFTSLFDHLKASGISGFTGPRVATLSGEGATMYVGNKTNSVEFACTPVVTNQSLKIAVHGKVINVPAGVTNQFSADELVENKGGIVMRAKMNSGSVESNLVMIIGAQMIPTNFFRKNSRDKNGILEDKNFRVVLHALQQRGGVETLAEPEVVTSSGRRSVNQMSPASIKKMEQQLNRVSGDNSSETLTKASPNRSGQSSNFSMTANVAKQMSRISISTTDGQSTNLETRVFSVNASFASTLRSISDLPDGSVLVKAENLFEKLGVDLNAPGRSIAFNDERKQLFVKATASELEMVEHAILALRLVTPEIHIKARFIEVPKDFPMAKILADDGIYKMTGTLTSRQTKNILKRLQANSDVEILAEPEVVTTSGRQTHMRVTQTKEVLLANASNQSLPQIKEFQNGPIVDVISFISADGRKIDLTVNPSIVTFPGDENTSSPVFRRRETAVHVKIQDNQTLVLRDLKSVFIGGDGKITTESKALADAEKKDADADKKLFVFVTATIVDAAGNRVYSEK